MAFDRNRRSFVTRIGGLVSVGGAALAAQSAAAPQQPGARAATGPDRSETAWLDDFKGKHKQVYDLMWHTLRPNTLNPPMFYFDTHRDVSGLEHPDVNVVVAVNTSFAINVSDALWKKYQLGERSEVKDPATGEYAVRNIYLGTGKDDRRSSVRALQARGAVFIQCRVALQGAISGLARDFHKPVPEVEAEVMAGLNPGVRMVPALTWAVGLLQERGFTYEKL